MKKVYKLVSCSFMDDVELSAIKGQTGNIRYYDGNEIKEIEDAVLDWKVENREEFLITRNGRKIRMDHIVRLFEYDGPAAKE